VAGNQIAGGAPHALSLLRQTGGMFDVAVRREVGMDPNRSGESTPTTSRSFASDDSITETWGPATRVMIMKGRDLGITVSNHAPGRPGPGVCVEALEPDGACALAGVTVECALLAIDGRTVTTHQKAISELERASKESSITAAFEVIIRPPRADEASRQIVQCL